MTVSNLTLQQRVTPSKTPDRTKNSQVGIPTPIRSKDPKRVLHDLLSTIPPPPLDGVIKREQEIEQKLLQLREVNKDETERLRIFQRIQTSYIEKDRERALAEDVSERMTIQAVNALYDNMLYRMYDHIEKEIDNLHDKRRLKCLHVKSTSAIQLNQTEWRKDLVGQLQLHSTPKDDTSAISRQTANKMSLNERANDCVIASSTSGNKVVRRIQKLDHTLQRSTAQQTSAKKPISLLQGNRGDPSQRAAAAKSCKVISYLDRAHREQRIHHHLPQGGQRKFRIVWC